ncbi:unnamed protein product, partial [Rotaria magnacalcarata]
TEEIHSRTSISSVSNESSKASKVERIEKDAPPSVEVNKGEKRSIDEPLEEEDIPISERINKRIRIAEKENDERLSEMSNNKSSPLQSDKTSDDNQATGKKRKLPSNRTNKESKAAWVRKYDIEGCCIQLNKSDIMYAIGRD